MKRGKRLIEWEIEKQRDHLAYTRECIRQLELDAVVRLDEINSLKRELYRIEGTRYANGQRMYSDDGTMLNERGTRSVFDDVDEV